MTPSFRVRPRRRLFVAAAAGVLALAPATAHASSVAVTAGPQILFTADPGEQNLVAVSSDTAGEYVVEDSGSTITPGAGCAAEAPGRVRCTVAGLNEIRLELGDGNDSATDSVPNKLFTALGQDGDDSLSGPDVVGNILDGGSGDDLLVPGAFANDRAIGGAGQDVVSYAARTEPLTIDNDGGYGSGGFGEYDLVGTDVEELVGGSGADVVRGNDAADVLRGGAGADKLLGGDGPDKLYGDGDADTLDGQSGADLFDAGAGDDAVASRDSGVAETVACGDGADTATADREDTLGGCEAVSLPAAPATTQVVVEKPVETVVERVVEKQAEPVKGQPVVVTLLLKELVYQPAKGAISVSMGCGADQVNGCKGQMVITATPAAIAKAVRAGASRKRKSRPVTLAKVNFNLKRGETKTVLAKISRRGVKQAFGGKDEARAPGKRKVKATMSVAMRNADGSQTKITKPVTVSGALGSR